MNNKMVQKSRKNLTKNCHCTIKRILSKEETEFIKWLFQAAAREGPKSNLIAEIKDHANCKYCYSVGYQHYCDNLMFTNKFLEQKRRAS